MPDFYHARALQYRSKLWQSHLQGVAEFVSTWKAKKKLLLIGPSAGYSLPLAWLARFESIQVVEPSKSARWIFARRLSREFKDLDTPPQLTWIPRALHFESPDFLSGLDLDGTSVLFANVLGQIQVRSEAALSRSLKAALQHLDWASFHDRFSSRQVHWSSPEGWVNRLYTTPELIPVTGRARELPASRFKKPTQVQEHLASAALSSLEPKRALYWDWQITPKQVHLIEGVMGL